MRPVYAPGGAGQVLRGQVRPRDPVSRNDYQFVAAFEDALGRADAPRFGLTYSISVTNRALELRRLRLGRVTYTLTEIATGAVRAQGVVTAEAAFSTTSTPLASLTAEEDATQRLMRMLADRLVAQILANPDLADV